MKAEQVEGIGRSEDLWALVMKVKGKWHGENAIYFEGGEQFICTISRHGIVETKRRIDHEGVCLWFAQVAAMGRDFVRGLAEKRWWLHMAGHPRDFRPATPVPGFQVKYTLQEAADYTRLSLSTIRKLIKEGKIGVERLSRKKNFIYHSELEGFLRNRRTGFIYPV